MEKLILIIEDLPGEQEKAKEAVISSGNKPIVASNLQDGVRLLKTFSDDLFGVISDIHYQSRPDNKIDAGKPNGLAMVALCIEKGIRTAVCSDIDSHFSQYLNIPLGVFESHQNYNFEKIPVSRNSKDWNSVLKELLNL